MCIFKLYEEEMILPLLLNKTTPDLILYTMQFLSIKKIQQIKFVNQALYLLINNGNRLFKIHFRNNTKNKIKITLTPELINDCATFTNASLYKTMCRLVSFQPMIAFQKSSFSYNLPLVTLNNYSIQKQNLTCLEKSLFKRKLETSYNVLNNNKWNTEIEHFVKNMNSYFQYSKWKQLLYGHNYLVGGAVLACLRKSLNQKFASERDLDFFVIHPYYNYNCYKDLQSQVRLNVYSIACHCNDSCVIIKVPDNRDKKKETAYNSFYIQSILINFNCNLQDMKMIKKHCKRKKKYSMFVPREEKNVLFIEWIKIKEKTAEWIKMQFILPQAIYTLTNLLRTFDIDLCQIAFDGQNIQSTPAALRSMQTDTIISYKIRNNPTNSQIILNRINKYVNNYNMELLEPLEFEKNKMMSNDKSEKELQQYKEQYEKWFCGDENINIQPFLDKMSEFVENMNTKKLDIFKKNIKKAYNFDWFQMIKQFDNAIRTNF